MLIACIALLVALGGTAVAAKKLVNGDKLIKKQSLSGNRLRKNTITGTQVNAATLGKVPSAKSADSLGGNPASAFQCPSGTLRFGGSCIETAQRGPLDWFDSSKLCGGLGRHLPSADQLNSVGRNGQLSWTGSEWSSNVDSTLKVVLVSSGGILSSALDNTPQVFRCAFNPLP